MSVLLAGPGISGYSHATEEAGPSLAQCLQQAKEVIPSAQHKETPVYLGATAGMRLLRYCRARPLLLQHCTWDRHGCAVGASREQSLDTLPAHTVPGHPPVLLTSLSPESPGLFPCLPLTPTLHHLLHPHAAKRHQDISSAQADLDIPTIKGCSNIPTV